MFADAMMKHLHYIFLFMCLALGMSAILQEEQPALRMLTEASADASVTPAPTGCFISMSTDYFSTIAHRPFFNDENNERKINGVLFQVETSDEDLKTSFYTRLYHACQTPFTINDYSGSYKGSDGKVYKSQQLPYYHGWSIWDTYRTK